MSTQNSLDIDNFKSRLRQIVDNSGLSVSKFSEKTGISRATLYKWLDGATEPSIDSVAKMSSALDIDAGWLITGEGGDPTTPSDENATLTNAQQFSIHTSSYTLVPFYDVSGAAGPGTYNEEPTMNTSLAFQTDWIRSELGVNEKDLIVVKAQGYSMRPVIDDRDVLLVNKGVQQFADDAIYLLNMEGVLRVKRLVARFDGSLDVISDNPQFPSERIARDEAHIIGRVVWIGKRV